MERRLVTRLCSCRKQLRDIDVVLRCVFVAAGRWGLEKVSSYEGAVHDEQPSRQMNH